MLKPGPKSQELLSELEAAVEKKQILEEWGVPVIIKIGDDDKEAQDQINAFFGIEGERS